MKRTIIIAALLALVALTVQGQEKEPFFRTDSAFIVGKIVGVKTETLPEQVSIVWNNALASNLKRNSVDVAADGSFTCRMQLHHPVLGMIAFSANEQVQFHLMPGETLHIALQKDADGHWSSVYGDGSSAKQVERLLKENFDFIHEYHTMAKEESDLKRHTEVCDSLIRATFEKLETVATARQFTSYERQLARTMATSTICAGFLDRHISLYIENLERWFSDSTFMANLCAPEYYAPLKYLPLNDPVLFVPYCFSMLTDKLHSTPVCASASFLLYYAGEQQKLRRAVNNMTGDEDNLLTQMAMMQKLPRGLTAAKDTYETRLQAMADTTLTPADRSGWAQAYEPLDTVRHRALDGFTNPELRNEAERLFALTFDDSFAYPVPEGSGKALLERILAPYRGQFVLIDFWAMWCMPCRQAIVGSRKLRHRLKDNPDLRLIFVAQEDEPETNESYKRYVRDNLLGADCYSISREELNQLMELLRFGGIPQYVTVLPDGRLLRNSLNYKFDNYELFLQRLRDIKTKFTSTEHPNDK